MIEMFLLLVIVGVVLYLVDTYVPMDPAIKVVVRVLVVLLVCLYLLRVFGIVDLPLRR